MVKKVTSNVDADTLKIDDEKIRVLGVNTAESVAVNEDRNTEEGKIASDRVKQIVPEGTEVRTEEYGRGKFGRRLADVKLLSNGSEVDMGLLLLDQSMSQYNVDYGEHPNPEQHDIYKEYFSENAPYQYADKKNNLSPEELGATWNAIQDYEKAEIAYSEGDITREEYEAKMVAAYGDGKKVAQMRYQLMDWDRQFQMEKYDNSDRMAYDWANQSEQNREKYDRAVRLGEVMYAPNPEVTQGFWRGMLEDTKTAFSTFNDFAVLSRATDLNLVRKWSDGADITDSELIKGITNPEYNKVIMEEAVRNGDEAALMLRDNIIISEQNEAAMAEMSLPTQIITAVPAVLLSPLTVIPGAKVAQGTLRVGKSIDTVMAAGRLRHLAIPAKVTTYSLAGATEAGIAALPRVTTDETFTSEDMVNEMVWGAAFGSAIPTVVSGAKRINKHTKQMLAVRKKVQAEKIARAQPEHIEVPPVDQPPEPVKTLTDEGENVLDKDTLTPEMEPEKVEAFKSARKIDRDALTEHAQVKVANALTDFKPVKWSSSVANKVSSAGYAKSFTQTMLESDSKVANYIGDKILELPQGFGGKKVRAPSATLMQHADSVEYRSMVQPQYHKLVADYAAESGLGRVRRFIAQWMDDSNSTVNAFSRDVATVIENRRQGRPIGVKSKAALEMADAIESAMVKMFDDQVEAGVTGFKKGKRIQNYYPQLWDGGRMKAASKKYGKATVQRALAKGYLQSAHNRIDSMAEAMKVADGFMNDTMSPNGAKVDHAMPATIDARARTRLDIDSTAREGDLSVMDLMQTDLSTVTAKYANRAAGNVAVAKATGGAITSEFDWAELRKTMVNEGATAKDLQLFDDAQNIVYGRPTRDGLDQEIRQIKDAVAQSKMGGLGMAQLAEAGQVITRSMMHLFSDPKVTAKIWRMAKESTDDVELMREVQALSGISNEVHLLDRQAVHLDQATLKEIKGVRKAVAQVVDKLTFSDAKAPAGYILAQGSGFNMVRRFERRIANASFVIDTAKHFKNGTGKMSPERLKDIGLDPNSMKLQKIFRDVVEYDEHGIVKKLNIDKWDKATREAYHYAMYRDDATMVQQSIGGEMPAWINRPMMTVVAQFKQMAILGQKKSLERNLQFADKEAVMGTMLNIALAGATRTAKFATLGAAAYAVTGDESEMKDPTKLDYLYPEKYVTQFGYFPDIAHNVINASEAVTEDGVTWENVGRGLAGEVPMLDWAKDYYQAGAASTNKERANAAKGVMILGNMQWADTLYKALEEQLED